MIRPIHKQEGVTRLLDWFLRVRIGTTLSRLLIPAISSLIPAFLVAHMLFGVGFKAVRPSSQALEAHR